LIRQLIDSWRRADPPFAPALCEPLIAACARQLLQAERGSTVVDVGCGTGSMLATFAAAGFRSIGIDANPMVAGTRPADARLILGDGERLPLRSGSVDALFAFSAFQYMDRDRALSECSRVLKPGGRFAVVENLAGNPFARLERAKRRFGHKAYPRYFAPRHHLRWQERAIYERHFSEVAYEAHHVIAPLFLWFRALAVPAPPMSRWNRSVLAALRVLQRVERRVLAAGLFRGAAWHLVVVGRK
jgi:SAM-dependent methyltransferase